MGKSGKKKLGADLAQSPAKIQSLSEADLKTQLQTLLRQSNYRQALDKIKQIHQAYPNATLSTTEASVWLLKGQQEYAQCRYSQAEISLRTALGLGLKGEAHYWLAKCFLAINKILSALEILQNAFETQDLPQDYGGCYLKLLVLNQNSERVLDLITNQANRFSSSQINWARGILSLQANDPLEALFHFELMDKKASPGDIESVWLAYAHQQNGDWEEAKQHLGLNESRPKHFFLNAPLPKPPVIERLIILQGAAQKQSLSEHVELPSQNNSKQSLLLVIELLNLLQSQEMHDAAHLLRKLSSTCRREYPEIEPLFRPVMILAGEQAFKEEEPECTQKFWESIVYQPPFDREIALKLNLIYIVTENVQERQRLLSYILNQIKSEAKTHPQDWPQDRFHAAQAKIYCWIFDTWMVRDQRKQAFKALQEAELLSPTLPDVIGRQGIKAKLQGDHKLAIALLKQALDGGSEAAHLYEALQELLKHDGDPKALKEARRRYGKDFGDLTVDTEVEISPWIEALSMDNYFMFEDFVKTSLKSQKDPTLQACQIFAHANDESSNSLNRINFDHSQAQKEWDSLLANLTPPEQVPVYQAILIAMHKFAKRQKGLTALQKQYHQRLLALADQTETATAAALVVMAVKEKTTKPLTTALNTYLERSPQPGTALAKIQLQARAFTQTEILRSFIQLALQREPQNPLLLLAQATTFSSSTSSYKKTHEQGFELARRLQDASALQAYREEEFFQTQRMRNLLNLRSSPRMGPDLQDLARRFVEEMFGEGAPSELIDQILPNLMNKFDDEMPDFFTNDDDDDGDQDFFDFDPFSSQKKKTKKKRRFTDL